MDGGYYEHIGFHFQITVMLRLLVCINFLHLANKSYIYVQQMI